MNEKDAKLTEDLFIAGIITAGIMLLINVHMTAHLLTPKQKTSILENLKEDFDFLENHSLEEIVEKLEIKDSQNAEPFIELIKLWMDVIRTGIEEAPDSKRSVGSIGKDFAPVLLRLINSLSTS